MSFSCLSYASGKLFFLPLHPGVLIIIRVNLPSSPLKDGHYISYGYVCHSMTQKIQINSLTLLNYKKNNFFN